jgi:hypothetical protein
MTAAVVQQVDSANTIGKWRLCLAIVGLVAIVVGVLLQINVLAHHQITKVMVTGKSPDLTTITKTGPSGSSSALIGGILAGGAVLLLVAALFTRITKIVLPGGAEIDTDTASQLAGAIATTTSDAAVGTSLFKRAVPAAARKLAEKHSAPLTSAEVNSVINVAQEKEDGAPKHA